MCTGIIEKNEIEGSSQGRGGWFAVTEANVSYDHPYHAPGEYTLNIDFVAAGADPSARVAVELTFESAQRLANTILIALKRGADVEGRQIAGARA